MNTQNGQSEEANVGAESQAGEPRKISRREALALVGKHAVYTAPAVLAVLALTKSGDAQAKPCISPNNPVGCTPDQ